MASINLLPRKEFKITLDDGSVVTGKFGTWALKRYCQKRNIALKDVVEKMESPEIDDAMEFILSAVEQSFREAKSKDSFPYNDVDACMWCDQLGGMAGEDFIRLFNHASDRAVEEKKSDQQVAA